MDRLTPTFFAPIEGKVKRRSVLPGIPPLFRFVSVMDNQSLPPGAAPPPLPPPRARRNPSGSGWKIAVIVLVVLLCFSLFGNLLGIVGSILSGNSTSALAGKYPFEEILLEDNEARRKFVVISVDGIIMDAGITAGPAGLVPFIKEQLKTAGEDRNVDAVILKINSPGGEVLASDEIYRALRKFQKDYTKPVIATMGSVAASGGYYVAAPCRWIVANELTITGSIGVIMQTYNYRNLMDKVGVRSEVFKSGRFKDMLSASKLESEISDEERAMVQTMVDETFERFKAVVREGRTQAQAANQGDHPGRTLAEDWADYADGRILSGNEAFKHGFVDELGNFETAYERALQVTGNDRANLVQYRPFFTLGNLFRLLGKADVSAGATVKVDLGLTPSILEPGRPYFLAPSFVR